ncbi:hypothetical protein [uncultured Ruegeria sp.]|uniref:hypothetical protein n=1 Tax=uncultured Ruegeria sp. TaxID=259304 RepID=UPI00260CD878|nr:hypothetical protein [uncultured Ruegeria sp.]
MERFSKIKRIIVAPALVITLTAGSAMAGPGQHFASAAQNNQQIGQSEISHDAARQGEDTATTVVGKVVNLIANLSPLDATQVGGSSKKSPTVSDEAVNHTTNSSSLETMQDLGTGAGDMSGKLLQSQKASGDFYLDGEAHFQSVRAAQDNGFADTNTLIDDTNETIKQDTE